MRGFFTKIVLCGLAAVLLAPAPVWPEYFFNQDEGLLNQVDVVVGESKVVPVANPKRIAVGDATIADVVGTGRTEILVSAKAAGETNLQIWDDSGQREIAVRVFEEDLNKLKKRLEDLFRTAGLKAVYFQVGDQERKVFVLGEVALRKKPLVDQLLENFKDRVINLVTFKEDNPLVEIDVQIMEISKTAIDRLGVTWNQSIVFNESTPASHNMARLMGDLVKAIGQSHFNRTALTMTLNILEQDNLARTLARPKLVALSGKEAKILVGGSVPILSSVSVSSGTTTTAVDYVDYGIKLNIKPEVKETGDIDCQLEVEIKTIDSSTQLTVQTGSSQSTSTPGFKTRNVTSELYLKNNETAFLAGLIDNEQSNNLTNVPGLSNLPVFGALFRSKNFQVGDTELVVSLTPKVVRYGDMQQDVEEAQMGKAAGMVGTEEPAEMYVREVQRQIIKNVTYPAEAQRSNLSGEVVLSLHLLSNGQLIGVTVNQSSGHNLLDKAAIYTVKRLAPYPAFPKSLFLKEIWVEVPIAYQMN